MEFKWVKRWNFSNALYCEDFIISPVHFPDTGYQLEQVAADGVTIRYFGVYSSLDAAKHVAESEMKNRIK